MMIPIKGKRPKKRKLNARELFKDRAKREGRIEEYNRRYKENKTKPQYSWVEAAQKAMDDMGFISVDLEREMNERFMRFGEAGIPEQLVAAQDQIKQGALIETLGEFDINESELPVDIAFVFHNLHKAVGEQSQWKVTPSEAPSPGAWNMLIWAADNQTKFFDKMGTLFFVVSTIYIFALIWKTYVWWQWINSLQNVLDINNKGLTI